MSYPMSISEALDMSLEELAPCGDIGGIRMASVPEDHPESEIDNLIKTQLRDNPSVYKRYNVTSLGNIARIIISGKNSKLVSRAQQNYDNFKRWYNREGREGEGRERRERRERGATGILQYQLNLYIIKTSDL